MTSTDTAITDDDSLVLLEKNQSGLQSLRKLVKGFCGGGRLFKAEPWDSKKVDLNPKDVAEGAATVASEDEIEPESQPEHQTREISIDKSAQTASRVTNEAVETHGSGDPSARDEEPVKETKKEANDSIVEVLPEGDAGESIEVVNRELSLGDSPSNSKGESGAGNETDDEDACTSAKKPTDAKNRSSWMTIFKFFLFWTLFVVSSKYIADGFESGDFTFYFSKHRLQALGIRLQQAVETNLVQSTSKLIGVDEIAKEAVKEASRVRSEEASEGKAEEPVADDIETVKEASQFGSEKLSGGKAEDTVDEDPDITIGEQYESSTATGNENVSNDEAGIVDTVAGDSGLSYEQDELIDLDSENTAENEDVVEEKVVSPVDSDGSLGFEGKISAGEKKGIRPGDLEHLELFVGSKKVGADQATDISEELMNAELFAVDDTEQDTGSLAAESVDTTSKTRPLAFVKVPASKLASKKESEA